MPEFLFTVESLFTIFGRGVVLVPGLDGPLPLRRIGEAIELRRPDGSSIRTSIGGLERHSTPLPPGKRKYPLILPPGLGRDEVPIGTEVWTIP